MKSKFSLIVTLILVLIPISGLNPPLLYGEPPIVYEITVPANSNDWIDTEVDVPSSSYYFWYSLFISYSNGEACSSYENGVAIHAINDLADLSLNSTLRSMLLFECKLDKEQWSQVLLSSSCHLEKAYDYFFVLDNDNAFYCSELLYTLMQLDRSQVSPSRKILGREFLLPSDLVQYLMNSDESVKRYVCKGSIVKSNGQIIKNEVLRVRG